MIENRKHCADAESRAVVRAETRADAYAKFRAVPRADHLQHPVQIFVQIVMQKRWLKRQNEAAMLHFVSIWFRFGSVRYKIAPMQKDLQNIVQMSVQKQGAEGRWKSGQVAVQNPVQSLMQMLVQILVQKKMAQMQINLQKAMQNQLQPRRGDLFIVSKVFFLPVAPAERPVMESLNRSLRWSYSNRWLMVSYKQVAPLELKRRTEHRAESRAVRRAESVVQEARKLRADCCGIYYEGGSQNW